MHYWVKGFGKREEWSGGCNSLCFPLPTPTSQCSNWRILISGCEWRLSVVQTRWFRYHPCTTHKDISTHTAEISIFLLIIGINNSILFKKWRIFCTRLLTAVTDYWNQMAKAILELDRVTLSCCYTCMIYNVLYILSWRNYNSPYIDFFHHLTYF